MFQVQHITPLGILLNAAYSPSLQQYISLVSLQPPRGMLPGIGTLYVDDHHANYGVSNLTLTNNTTY